MIFFFCRNRKKFQMMFEIKRNYSVNDIREMANSKMYDCRFGCVLHTLQIEAQPNVKLKKNCYASEAENLKSANSIAVLELWSFCSMCDGVMVTMDISVYRNWILPSQIAHTFGAIRWIQFEMAISRGSCFWLKFFFSFPFLSSVLYFCFAETQIFFRSIAYATSCALAFSSPQIRFNNFNTCAVPVISSFIILHLELLCVYYYRRTRARKSFIECRGGKKNWKADLSFKSETIQ